MKWKCAHCQQTRDDHDKVYLDEDLFSYCSPYCYEQGFNLGLALSDTMRSVRGWQHTKIYHQTFTAFYYTKTAQDVYDASIHLFKKYNFPNMDSSLHLSQEILKTVFQTKKMTRKQQKALCIFIAKVVSFEIVKRPKKYTHNVC